MKKLIAVTTFIALGLVAHADISMPKGDTLFDKIGRSLGNIAAAPNEITDSILSVTNDEGPIAGATKGLVQGIYRGTTDVGHGIFGLLTGPIPVGPYYSYQSWKQPPNNSSLVQEYPPSDVITPYLF